MNYNALQFLVNHRSKTRFTLKSNLPSAQSMIQFEPVCNAVLKKWGGLEDVCMLPHYGQLLPNSSLYGIYDLQIWPQERRTAYRANPLNWHNCPRIEDIIGHIYLATPNFDPDGTLLYGTLKLTKASDAEQVDFKTFFCRWANDYKSKTV
jgi:hypothetical protein